MSQAPFQVFLADEEATGRLGADLALALRAGDVLALRGDLGAGKTTLARALIRALAGDPHLEVPSPTFTLVQAYEARVPVAHFDLYRVGDPEELTELGFEAALRDGAVLIEWPERAGGRLPPGAATLTLAQDDGGRQATIDGSGDMMERIGRTLAIRRFLEHHGWGEAERRHLMGDASARSYETAHLPGQPVRIVMNAPPLVLGPPVKDGKAYAEIAHTARNVSAFVAIDGMLAGRGVTVPEIHAADLDDGFLLIEHLGSEPFLRDGAAVPERYIAAARLLAAMHGQAWPAIAEAGAVRHPIPPFDRPAQMIEVELLVDWYLPHMTGAPAPASLRAEFQRLWNAALDGVAGGETSILLRDYHSPNIIWRGDRQGHDRLGIIDFQDAMSGPTAYDLASLALDARVTIPPGLERDVVEAYAADRAAAGQFDRDAFDHAYAVMAAHRNSKILGGFVRLDRRDGKPFYLKHLPRIRDYVRRTLAHPELTELRGFYEENRLLEDR